MYNVFGLNKYTLNFNKYWYSSYEPRYELFWKKSPLDITKDDWNNEIKEWKIGNYLKSVDYKKLAFKTKNNILNKSILFFLVKNYGV